MDTTSIDKFFADVAGLGTPDEMIAALKKAVSDTFGANADLQSKYDQGAIDLSDLKEKYTALETESTEEIERLSKELSFATSTAGKTTLSVTVDGVRYVTPAGRKYNVNHKEGTPIEDILKDDVLVAKLIANKSGIFKVSAE